MSAPRTAVILKEIANQIRVFCIYLLYRLAQWAAVPLLPFYFSRRIRRDRRYGQGFRERLGELPFPVDRTAAAPIWLHAVSVGEVLSAVPLVKALRELDPAVPVYVSCTTVAGRELAEAKLRGLVNGLFFVPLDLVRFVRRVLNALRPALVVILETEIWPNLWREAKRHGAGLIIVNGRMSDRAFPRYRKLRWFFSAALAQACRILVQSERDRERYLAAGAPQDRVVVGGNLKFDFHPAEGEIAPEIRALLDRLKPGAVWIAASTMPPVETGDVDEVDAVIDAFAALAPRHPNLLLILVPRRPEGFDAAAAKLRDAGVRFVRRSAIGPLTLPGVLLLDTIGELSRLFAVADVVFMGGTLARRGGHNILEPAFFAKPVVVGPHMENFAEIAAEFADAGATVQIDGPAQLAPAVERLLGEPAERRRIGELARSIAAARRGVTARIAAELMEHYDRALPQTSGSALLAPLAALWRAGVAADRARTTPRRLPAPVISIGNITTGGSGKTPLTAWLAAELAGRGLRPAILTRGYRRRSTARFVVVPAGERCPVEQTGDEAQIFVQRGAAHLGIGADRFETGSLIAREYGADLFLLDDGLQHWKLERDLDIVLIDVLNPFGGGHLTPRGRLREPLDALGRAGAIVLTRTESGIRTSAIERIIRAHNPRAPLFRAAIRPSRWVNLISGETAAPGAEPFHRVGAFCGLGNPAGFSHTLRGLPLDVAFEWTFGDHHRYTVAQVRRLLKRATGRGVDALVTTEKDACNLPPLGALEPRVPVWRLEIEVEVDGGGRLLELISGIPPERRAPGSR